jgi:hypothetical protein
MGASCQLDAEHPNFRMAHHSPGRWLFGDASAFELFRSAELQHQPGRKPNLNYPRLWLSLTSGSQEEDIPPHVHLGMLVYPTAHT